MHAERGGTAGFTLIEVMVALVILAVGLLSLEALGIGAARMVTLSEKQGRFSTLAASSMESLRNEVLRAPATLPIDNTADVVLMTGDTAVVRRQATRQSQRQARLAVTVTPKTTGPRLVRAASITLNSYLFDPRIP